ncbi:LOW QUALITY PROTEIN: fertilization-influencing membrane protein [Marmota marmota marmota]|uniref:LOW QUALITY PROTEIN: fertilization-influencing membrane protein n=1 Tax=Marmota marmota marmota TaxID=9994 RepID=UPI002093BB8B|nr:LOW QUALITY PROTEIN: fertilization-influencing membrane protein [Marmota marmota marmota]
MRLALGQAKELGLSETVAETEYDIRKGLSCDIIEPYPVKEGVMRRWQWVPMWVWLAGLGAIETGVCLAVVTDFAWTLAPSPELAPGSEPPLFIDRLDFFDYPDSDQASILAVAQFIGERPVVFVKSGSSPGLFNHILVGALVVAFLFLLFQFCTHM